ncbi:MAG: HAMP domain-containing histidine kinase [Deltaproteobacteria bacterium]|nr:HAMP domain-containing histidine kinase [Deltaproteobacteria bacterium]
MLNLSEFSVRDAVRDAVDMVMPAAEKKAQKLGVDIGEGVGTIMADRTMFFQMLFNLLDNAVRYTPVGGMVDLTVLTDFEKSAEVLRVRVKDTGVGIKPQFKGAIFEFFEMGNESFVREHDGLGVGLPLTKRLVEFHGGRIWFESEPGKGSIFEFFIPVGSLGKGG